MDINKEIWQYRPLCLIQEMLRYAWHKSLGSFICSPTPVWYNFGSKCGQEKREYLKINKDWYSIHRNLYRHENVFYNIDNALKTNPSIKGLALIFFMDIGDYLYTTPMIAALAKKYPKLKLYAYVSKNMDRNNSPLVAPLLETNPNIDKVFYFDGYRNPVVWKNYNYKDAFKDIPEDFLVMPVYYDYSLKVPHRTYSLFETFGLPLPLKKEPPKPVFYFSKEPKPAILEAFNKINKIAKRKKGIVFLQLDSRGSNYTYPHTDTLIRALLRDDYFVISATKSAVIDDNFYLVDFKKFAFNDTASLLHLLKAENKVYVISINSVFWAASAGLGLPNLGLQHWIDKKVHNLWYPNILVVTDYIYPKLPKNKMFLAGEGDYKRHNKKIIDYEPAYILKSFNKMISKESQKESQKEKKAN
ncbi:MAG: hypothetical protein LBM71_04920 [Elusimicrobiota bacterium]|jgi:hypothetical protein|nr:hypothetical protein [Elusimicrobiota bacterium]